MIVNFHEHRRRFKIKVRRARKLAGNINSIYKEYFECKKIPAVKYHWNLKVTTCNHRFSRRRTRAISSRFSITFQSYSPSKKISALRVIRKIFAVWKESVSRPFRMLIWTTGKSNITRRAEILPHWRIILNHSSNSRALPPRRSMMSDVIFQFN